MSLCLRAAPPRPQVCWPLSLGSGSWHWWGRHQRARFCSPSLFTQRSAVICPAPKASSLEFTGPVCTGVEFAKLNFILQIPCDG